MTKSEIFKAAHKLAKETISTVGDYLIAFSLALKEVYKKMNNMKSKLIAMGFSVWGEHLGKARIYINVENMQSVFGLKISQYKTGNISSAWLNGEKISNSKAGKLIDGKVYFDCDSEKFVGTELKPII